MKMSKDSPREIIEDFAKEIEQARDQDTKPENWAIDFRNERKSNIERPVYRVPIDLLRYRKDNGRIASDVYSYEKDNKPLSEIDVDDQKIIAKFLEEKDPEQTEKLKNSIAHSGQEQPVIITCDGFLINGNRRRMVFEMLWDKTKDEQYKRMKVVILPGKHGPGGPPTIKEIEQIENRYQLQSDGKSDYSHFDRALSIRRKIQHGMTLAEQLRDDPNFVNLSQSSFQKEVEKYDDEFLKPLDCIDKYLESLDREGVYTSISSGIGDRQGKWQAFFDYYKSVYKKITNAKDRIKLGIEEDEIGKVEDLAFKLIRCRELIPGLKVHEMMRDLPRFLSHVNAKEELFEICEIEPNLPAQEMIDDEGREYDHEVLDKKWVAKHRTDIIRQVTKARDLIDKAEEMETPIGLLEQAYKKLTHRLMNPDSIHAADIDKAFQLADKVEKRAKEIKDDFYHHLKSKDKFKQKFKINK